jgi:hypothetical protein
VEITKKNLFIVIVLFTSSSRSAKREFAVTQFPEVSEQTAHGFLPILLEKRSIEITSTKKTTQIRISIIDLG